MEEKRKRVVIKRNSQRGMWRSSKVFFSPGWTCPTSPIAQEVSPAHHALPQHHGGDGYNLGSGGRAEDDAGEDCDYFCGGGNQHIDNGCGPFCGIRWWLWFIFCENIFACPTLWYIASNCSQGPSTAHRENVSALWAPKIVCFIV